MTLRCHNGKHLSILMDTAIPVIVHLTEDVIDAFVDSNKVYHQVKKTFYYIGLECSVSWTKGRYCGQSGYGK